MKKETTLPDELARLLLLETDEDVKTEDDSPSLDYRRDIRSILTALYERAPYIYALFKAAPKTEFRIALTEDLSRGDLPDETYTIPEFCARYASFKPKGQIFLISFSVYCTEKEREETYRKYGEVFCSPEGTALCEIDSEDLDMAVEEIVSEFPNYMMCRCRAAILANEPLTIDEETIARYALTADGKLAVLADAAAEAAAPGLTFGTAGMNALRVTLALDDDNNVLAADSKAEFTRISTVNSMPESELAGYPTKEYVTRDGKTKTWMTTGLHWNGGAAMGTYKLGSGLVGGSKTGGYDEAEYSMRNPAYDTEENGGTLKELMMPDGVTTRASVYGRLYSSYETLTGDPAGALSSALLMPFPLGGAGTVVVDAVGNSITLEPILKADLKDYAASDGGNTQAEADHPSLSMQVQGICPYGWHIANMSDWKDLIYAVAESSKSYSDYPVAAATASYGAMTSGNAANVAAHLRCKEWQDPQGWRLYKSGYDYCANSGNVRFYCLIPMMGQTTASKMALWRAYCTTSADMVFDDGFDVGNGSGAAVRCVKNYENF